MQEIWQFLPDSLIDCILSYDNTLKKRNGLYMNQISKTDPRYNILLSIPKPYYGVHIIYNDDETISTYYFIDIILSNTFYMEISKFEEDKILYELNKIKSFFYGMFNFNLYQIKYYKS